MQQKDQYNDHQGIQNRESTILVKKRHTVKNTVVYNEKKKILVVTKTTKGSQHDKKQFDKSGLEKAIPKNITLWTDTGYQG